VTMLRHWDQLAQRPHLPSFTIEVLSQPCDMTRAGWQAITAARCAVQAAYLARDAVVHEHPAIGRQVVGEYVVRWLGLRPTAEIVEAAANALLQAPLDGTHPDGDHAVVRRLLAATRTQRRAWRPLGETKIRHARIDSLDRRLPGVGNEQPLVLADTVGTCDQPDAATAGWNDPRIPRVLARLHPAERRVALAYVHADPDTTWAQAAQQCGQEAAFGERVRRKLLREGRLLTTWLAASGPMHRAA